jgi:hypothetical protein
LSKIEVDTVEPQSGTSLTLGASGDTITIPAGATFDSSAATTTLPATVVTTTGTQTLSNKTIDATQLTGTVATSNLGTGTADATTFLRGDQTYAAAGNTLSISITPSSASNKIFIMVSGCGYNDTDNKYFKSSIFRDATNLGTAQGMYNHYDSFGVSLNFSMSYLDSPSSTSALTYQVYILATATSTSFINNNGAQSSITAFEIAG